MHTQYEYVLYLLYLLYLLSCSCDGGVLALVLVVLVVLAVVLDACGCYLLLLVHMSWIPPLLPVYMSLYLSGSLGCFAHERVACNGRR